MTQKKDRRSARTRKRESREVVRIIWMPPDCNPVSQLPARPRSHSSSAPMVPEVSQ